MIVSEKVRARLALGTRFAAVHEWPTVGSTNAWLLQQARDGAAEGTVAVADYQSAGRGRLGRHWEAPPGTALLVSVLLRPALPGDRLHLVTAAVALAARDACAEVGGFLAELKWPNDLLVGGRKLAGILAEVDGGAVVVGLGLNVSAAPPGAVSAEEAAGRPLDRGELLVALLESLERRHGHWEEVADAYRRACATIGTEVRVERPDGELTGLAEDVDADGRLVVLGPDGRRRTVVVGDVVHLRPAGGSAAGSAPDAVPVAAPDAGGPAPGGGQPDGYSGPR